MSYSPFLTFLDCETQAKTRSLPLRFLVQEGRSGHILQRHASAIENDDLLIRFAAWLLSRHDITQFGVHICSAHDPGIQVSGCARRVYPGGRGPQNHYPQVTVCNHRLKISALWCKTNIHIIGSQLVGDRHMATDKGSQEISRRSFIKRTAIGGSGLLIANDILSPDLAGTPKSANSTMSGVPFEARDRVRLGIIGVGGRGTSLLQDLLAIENVEVKAICDLVPEKVARAQKAVTNAGQPEPVGFSKGEWDFKNLTQLELDIVYIATPWNWHVLMALSAMKNSKHAAVERSEEH